MTKVRLLAFMAVVALLFIFPAVILGDQQPVLVPVSSVVDLGYSTNPVFVVNPELWPGSNTWATMSVTGAETASPFSKMPFMSGVSGGQVGVTPQLVHRRCTQCHD